MINAGRSSLFAAGAAFFGLSALERSMVYHPDAGGQRPPTMVRRWDVGQQHPAEVM